MESLVLSKGEKLDITKGNAGLTSVKLGLGWDVNAGNDSQYDLDASAILLNAAGKVVGPSIAASVVYFGNLKIGGVIHAGDNLTGAGDGDDEVIEVKIADVAAEVEKIVFVVNIYQAEARSQRFGKVKNAFIRAFDGVSGAEFGRYDLSEDYSAATGVLMGQLYRHNGEWKFETLGEGITGDLNAIVQKYS